MEPSLVPAQKEPTQKEGKRTPELLRRKVREKVRASARKDVPWLVVKVVKVVEDGKAEKRQEAERGTKMGQV